MIVCDNITNVNGSATPGYILGGLSNSTNATNEEVDSYDSYGALQFIITTVTVYAAMGVFCTLINNIRKKPNKQKLATQDEAVLKYLKQEKSLKLQGFHMQLKSLRDKYTVMVKQYEEKMRLLEIRKELEDMDTGSPILKRSRNTRRLSLFTLHHGIKDKFGGGKKRPSMDHSIGRAGFSLIHFAKSQPGLGIQEQVEEEDEEKSKASQSDISHKSVKATSIRKSAESLAKSDDTAIESVKSVDLERKHMNKPDTCVVDIENYKLDARERTSEMDTLLPPVTSPLSESV